MFYLPCLLSDILCSYSKSSPWTRPVPLDLEDVPGSSVLVLVCPDHSVRSEYTGKPTMGDDLHPSLPHVSSVSVGTGRRLRLHSLPVILCECLRFPSLVSLRSGLEILICAMRDFCSWNSWPLISSSWTSWPLNMGLIGCPETSAQNYQSMLRNIPEQRRSHLCCL
jgi:hypothetical protein